MPLAVSPLRTKGFAQGKAAAPILTGMSRPAAVNAKDSADAEQRLFPPFGISTTALTPPAPAHQQGGHYTGLKLIFYFSRGTSSLLLEQQLFLPSNSVSVP